MVPILVAVCVWRAKEGEDGEDYEGEIWIDLKEMEIMNRKLVFSFEVSGGVSELIIYRDGEIIASVRTDFNVQDILLEENYGFGESWLLVRLSKLVERAILLFNSSLLCSSAHKLLAISRSSLRLPPEQEERSHELFSMLCRQMLPKKKPPPCFGRGFVLASQEGFEPSTSW